MLALREEEDRRMSEAFWCVAANVVDVVKRGLQRTDWTGTKHFTGGTKVWCWPIIWGDGGERLNVVGMHRGGGRFITIVMDSRDLTNWRAKECYSPLIKKIMRGAWDGRTKEEAEKFAAGMLQVEKAREAPPAS